MKKDELRAYAELASKVSGDNIANATVEEITALFACPNLLIKLLDKVDSIEAELECIATKS
ncbi:hypothetical protein QTV49_003927 [Vibrio vulnificus]|nr:hypothetical protein [Vibrio vulnificus]